MTGKRKKLNSTKKKVKKDATISSSAKNAEKEMKYILRIGTVLDNYAWDKETWEYMNE